MRTIEQMNSDVVQSISTLTDMRSALIQMNAIIEEQQKRILNLEKENDSLKQRVEELSQGASATDRG